MSKIPYDPKDPYRYFATKRALAKKVKCKFKGCKALIPVTNKSGLCRMHINRKD